MATHLLKKKKRPSRVPSIAREQRKEKEKERRERTKGKGIVRRSGRRAIPWGVSTGFVHDNLNAPVVSVRWCQANRSDDIPGLGNLFQKRLNMDYGSIVDVLWLSVDDTAMDSLTVEHHHHQ